jgi:hypothetical protein
MRGLLLAHAEERADADIARWLKLRPHAPVIRMETVRKADGRPVSCATTWFPAERFAGMPAAYEKTESITRAFAELGLSDYVRATTEITATHADAGDIAALELTPGAIVSDHQGDEHGSGRRAGAIFDQPLLGRSSAVHNRELTGCATRLAPRAIGVQCAESGLPGLHRGECRR